MVPVRLPQRFQFVRELGRGGMGAVYEAIDADGGARVAIKTLPSNDPLAVARFKREFRSLADIHHPNLVALIDLFCEEGEWAFSMDLIDGTDLIDYLRPASTESPASSEFSESAAFGLETTNIFVVNAPRKEEKGSGERTSKAPGPLDTPAELLVDEEKLRDTFAQLADGLAALHAANKMHRDIKPSNIRVRPDGRLFLLDFGLVTELTEGDAQASGHENVLGTPAYMAPEQASGGAVGAAADWYSVGVVLFEALTGYLPFEGLPAEMILAKLQGDAPRVRALVPNAPADLDDLCARLLAFDPSTRPSAETVRRVLRPLPDSKANDKGRETLGSMATLFVGRQEQLGALEQAFARVQGGQAASVLLEGESGTGKSYLARQFLDRVVAKHPNALIVSGRCYENEAVPYNAWDGAIELLASKWMRLPPSEAVNLLPTHIGPLAQTFPALRQVPAVTRVVSGPSTLDPHEVRSRAFTALRELFARASQRGPVIVFLDDLQWADHDSVSLLAETLREPSAPPVLFLATARPLKDYPDVERELSDALPRSVQRCLVSQLPHEDAVNLATQLLARANPELIEEAESIAKEAAGHAFFITELVRHVGKARRADTSTLSLADALWARVTELPATAQSLLAVLSLAARPLPEALALRAAEVHPTEGARVLSALRVGHLTRTTRVAGLDWIETYHDRVRSSVADRIPVNSRAGIFERIALAFEGSVLADVSLLSDFWRAAGDMDRAGRYARDAGDQACTALAFVRAAAFYQTALERPSCTREERHELLVILGDTLAKAGRGKAAADAYQLAFATADGRQLRDLERKAAEQLLRTGHYDAGIELTKRVLLRVGVRWPDSHLAAVVSYITLSLLLFLRGRRFDEKKEVDVAPDDITRMDVCVGVGTQLILTDTIRAFILQMQFAHLAFRSGEPGRVALALTQSVTRASTLQDLRSPRQFERIRKRVAAARVLARRAGRLYEPAFIDLGAGWTSVLSCRPREGLPQLEAAAAAFRESCSGKDWEIVTCQLYAIRGCYYLGELARLSTMQSGALKEANDRGDLYGTVNLRLGFSNFAWLVRDDVEGARKALAEGLRGCSTRTFSTEQHYGVFAAVNANLYVGNAREALALAQTGFAQFRKSLVWRVQTLRLQSMDYCARACLAVARQDSENRRSLLDEAKRWTRAAARLKLLHAMPTARLLEAQIASIEGDDARTALLLRRAILDLLAADLGGYAAIARRALGQLIKGDEGAALVRESEAFLRAETVKNLPALSDCLAPGFALLS